MKRVIANGDFDRRVTVQSRTVAVDGWGGQGESWATDGTVWAKYTPQPMTGVALSEMADQPQFLEKATFSMRTPKSFTIGTDSRLVYGGANWKIIGMAEGGTRGEYTVVNAVKTDSNLND